MDENHHYSSMDMSIATEPFILGIEPHQKRVEGFPLDSLSIDIKTGKYYYDLEEKDVSTSVDDGVRTFFERSLKKENGVIEFKSNRFHNQHYYLSTDFSGIHINNAGRIFEEIARRLDKPLQVMISSDEEEKTTLLKAAGFICKRKCYEIEALKKDYIGGEGKGEILYSYVGEEIYQQCCELMLKRYIKIHKDISPWTGSKEDFVAELPRCVTYFRVDGKLSCFAFIEEDEIAYVYGESVKEFREFSRVLVTELFRKHEVITFEADDCDEMAMDLKALFVNQEDESFDTYIRERAY